jgi:hypothetical protein
VFVLGIEVESPQQPVASAEGCEDLERKARLFKTRNVVRHERISGFKKEHPTKKNEKCVLNWVKFML